MISCTVMWDYHIHTSLCKHAVGDMEEYVVEAIKRGLKEIAFCDHIPLPQSFDLEHRMGLGELEYYLREIERLNSAYGEINILTGIEADYLPEYEGFLKEFLNSYKFDIVLMSVHFVEGWTDGNWVFKYDFPFKTFSEIYEEYLNTASKGIETGLFDVFAHIDVVKRRGVSLMDACPRKVEEILDLMKVEGVSLEFNTSGLRKDINETFPSEDILSEAIKRDIPLTLGSDAHKPGQVGYCFKDLIGKLEILKEARIAKYCRREVELYSIEDYF